MFNNMINQGFTAITFSSNRGKVVHASAAIYSMIETEKANNIGPYGYLKYIIEQLPLAENIDQIEALLP